MSVNLNTNSEKDIETSIINTCSQLAKTIESNRELLVNELLQYESFETAEDEIWRSIDCLKNISKEFQWLSYGKVDLLCTIFPVNLPLYSLIIFAVIPSFMANEVIVRPPVLMRKIIQKIVEVINLQKSIPQIIFVDIERSLFSEAYISVTDAVVFTGRYENAKNVQRVCPDALFIYNGAGINPILIFNTAKIDYAVKKTIEMRVFNSGQDCAGTDVIFVHENSIDGFKQTLLSELEKVKVGDYKNRLVRVGRLVKDDHMSKVEDFFKIHTRSLVYGGKIDFQERIIYPTVIIENIKENNNLKTMEFFSPIFYIVTYQNINELNKYFSQKDYSDFAMYVSIFGDTPPDLKIPNSIILKNQIINDVERGNKPYGGYGPKANFVSYDEISYSRPLLISREIHDFIKTRMSKKKVTSVHSEVR